MQQAKRQPCAASMRARHL